MSLAVWGCGKTAGPAASRDPANSVNETGPDPASPPTSPAEAAVSVATADAIRFVDALPGSGIRFQHSDGGGDRQYITQTVVAGLALFDYDQDGWIDIYLLNGSSVPGNIVEPAPTNKLYRNNGDWTFSDVTDAAGVADTGYALGVAAADYDQDGDQDLYVNNFGANVLYRNNGDGTFTDVTDLAGVQCEQVGAGVAWADIDADGDLDLYVGNYVDFTYDNYRGRKSGPYEYAAAPQDYNPESDRLFRNNSDGTFTDISQASGLTDIKMPSMGVIAVDYDNDRDTDVVVCCDNAPNRLLRNDGSGGFEDVGVLAGFAHDLQGNNNGSMGVDAGDYDNDGLLDLYVTNYQGELSVLYKNAGQGFFTDVSRFSQVSTSSMPHVKWGTGFTDFDLDGHRDQFIACGHFIKHIQQLDDRTDVRVPNFVMKNLGNGKFADVTDTAGEVMREALATKGAAFDDLDNDGDIDVVLLNANERPSLLQNVTATENRALQLRLVGIQTNRDGVGARVTVVAGDRRQVAEVHSGRGYQSHFGMTLHFGYPSDTPVDRVEVDWIGGGKDVYQLPEGNTSFLLYEGGTAGLAVWGHE
ncbi:CRTAC1 family protein [Roseimaritima ulvae]|uniref:ASPIC and UnbV n=1 Tax=Roseimaritima ulvae TaxID=980254 RepID=A0A5B9QVZ4_9BACT|nr:CRTAC1 family protein [Roseimaritima ulvae]QEG38103.1 ASPIC and UnbV [Roseimaritima ulvae]